MPKNFKHTNAQSSQDSASRRRMSRSFLIMFGLLSRVRCSSTAFAMNPLYPRSMRIGRRISSTAPPKVSTSPAVPAPTTKRAPPQHFPTVLEKLASRVVRGSAEKSVPLGTQLKRRRSWDLYLGEAEYPGAAILVVNKKSSFTLEDARTALAIITDEVSARRNVNGDPLPSQHLLLTTRAGVAPVADAFLRGAQTRSSIDTCDATIMRWELLEELVRERSLGKYLATSTGRRDGSELPNAPSFALPQWLQEERERGMNAKFHLHSPFEPSGDQPEAIEALARGLSRGKRHQTLLGATGTGKTFIVANVIEKASLPTLVLAPNKVLAAQLTNELRALFPKNAVEFFVSYYDYFMPEAFVSASDTYIDKVVQINDDIDRMRHSATRSLLERRDVIVVASVSCIYGLGMPGKYLEASIRVVVGQEWTGGWRTLAQHLEQKLFYSPQHSEEEFKATPRGSFRTTVATAGGGGGVIEIGPASDEAVVSIAVDGAGIIRAIHVVPIDSSPETEEEGVPPPSVTSMIAAQGMGGSHDIACGDQGSEREQGANAVDAHVIYPAKHHVVGGDEMDRVLEAITMELEERCALLGSEGRVLEAERLRQRTENDLLLLRAVGTCKGVENYSRHLAGRGPGEPPETLVDYFPENDWLLVVDESHVSAPQLGAMWGGDRARKTKLVDHGFRLPSALDNRPLKAGEFWSKVQKAIFVSATPGKFELELSNPEHLPTSAGANMHDDPLSDALETGKQVASDDASHSHARPTASHEKIIPRKSGRVAWDEIGDLVDAQAVIRPTGITDPPVDIRPSEGQVADLVQECKMRGERNERVLVTALTKRMAEDLCAFLVEQSVPTAYLHSDVKPMQRLELLRQLRAGEVDVLVGVNLLREGLNLPEVSLVCVLDADAEGFLRSDTSLLQTIGRATRHQAGRAVLYADRITPSMRRALDETDRRRDIQLKHNERNGITPSVATAASVGDSLLDSIEVHGGTTRRIVRNDDQKHSDREHVASWAEHPLPPDQVQLLYDLAAQRGKRPARRRLLSGDGNSPVDSAGNSSVDRVQGTSLEATEGTSHALKRIAEHADSKMSLAASKTDFKEAALWRDRRDAVLSTLRQLENTISIGDQREQRGLAAHCT